MISNKDFLYFQHLDYFQNHPYQTDFDRGLSIEANKTPLLKDDLFQLAGYILNTFQEPKAQALARDTKGSVTELGAFGSDKK